MPDTLQDLIEAMSRHGVILAIVVTDDDEPSVITPNYTIENDDRYLTALNAIDDMLYTLFRIENEDDL